MMYNNFNWPGWHMWSGWNMMSGWWPGIGPGWMFVILLLAVWSLAWKGMALWKAARKGETAWFVALLVVNTAGILDILYLYVFSKKAKSMER